MIQLFSKSFHVLFVVHLIFTFSLRCDLYQFVFFFTQSASDSAVLAHVHSLSGGNSTVFHHSLTSHLHSLSGSNSAVFHHSLTSSLSLAHTHSRATRPHEARSRMPMQFPSLMSLAEIPVLLSLVTALAFLAARPWCIGLLGFASHAGLVIITKDIALPAFFPLERFCEGKLLPVQRGDRLCTVQAQPNCVCRARDIQTTWSTSMYGQRQQPHAAFLDVGS